jgi:hypothetical protein
VSMDFFLWNRGRLKQMNLSFFFSLHVEKLKALMQKVCCTTAVLPMSTMLV